jgi:tRNA A37 methylthiotransferase MiaB
MLKILFYYGNDALVPEQVGDSEILFLGIASLYLKTYIDINNPEIANQIEWMLPIQRRMSDENFIAYCNETKPDLICSSHYIWNHTAMIEQLGRIKQHISKDIKIAAGGPSIDVNIDPDFFIKYPFIDYAMYGAGEQAFSDLITSLVTKKQLIAFNTSNIAWIDKNKNKTVVAEFKYVPQSTISPFLHNEQIFSEMVKQEQDNNISVVIPYELTRGCPYSCTFCDWNSGLTNKVSRRKGSYQNEIDLFQKIKIKNLYLSDANVGQYQEDIDMIEYLGNKNINDQHGFKIDGNFSKLRKENNLKIYHILAKSDLVSDYAGFTISVQDIQPDVLENIDRPDVGWDEHLKIIKELKTAYPRRNSKIQLIQGLPGQTPESWRTTLAEISKHSLLLQPFISELLPASPAARDKDYQEKFKFTYSTSERYHGGHIFRGTFPSSCVSFSQKDFVKMTILTHLYTTLANFRSQTSEVFDLESVVDDFLSSKNYLALENNLYNNWYMNDKFYFSIDIDMKPRDISACHFISTASTWSTSLFILRLIAAHSNISPTVFIKKMLKLNNNGHYVSKIEKIEGFV